MVLIPKGSKKHEAIDSYAKYTSTKLQLALFEIRNLASHLQTISFPLGLWIKSGPYFGIIAESSA